MLKLINLDNKAYKHKSFISKMINVFQKMNEMS